MSTSGQVQVLIVGGGPLTFLTALMLHRAGLTVAIAGDPPPTSPPLNPELMLIGGDDGLTPLFQASLSRWRTVADDLGLPPLLTSMEAQDLATSRGRAEKLKTEAMFDAIGGESVVFTAPSTAVAAGTLGAKVWTDAPCFVPETLIHLQQAVMQAGITRLSANPVSLTVANLAQPQITFENGSTWSARHIVFTSARALRKVLPPLGLSLPLRPARGHILMLQTARPHNLPLMLQRLQRGHLFMVPAGPDRIDIHYDAINDPAQSTFNTRHSPSLAAALQQHVGQLVPALQGAALVGTSTMRNWLTPDFLPAIGPWPGLPGLLVGTGWGGRSTALAAGAAQALADVITTGTTDINIQPLSPNRFANGLWQVVKQPGSLTWQEEVTASIIPPNPQAEYMQNVNLVESPKVQYASNVQQVGKTVTENAGRRTAMQAKGKRKITTAGLRESDK